MTFRIGVKARRSRFNRTKGAFEDFGHVSVYAHDTNNPPETAEFRGFWPMFSSLPKEIIGDNSRLLAYLRNNKVDGVVLNDRLMREAYKRFYFRERDERFCCCCWASNTKVANELLSRAPLGKTKKFYSMSPDNQTTHNCVTFAVATINPSLDNLGAEPLPVVPTGSVSRFIANLEAIPPCPN